MANYISVECPHCGKEAARLRFGESAKLDFANNGQSEHLKATTVEPEVPPDEVLSKSVCEVVLAWPFRNKDLKTRAINCLEYGNVRTIGELINNTEKEMFRFKNFGPKTLDELRAMLHSMNLSFRSGPSWQNRD
jgi:DNA-directed RNA polymerase alpha subunit